jgi:hypothetical protein
MSGCILLFSLYYIEPIEDCELEISRAPLCVLERVSLVSNWDLFELLPSPMEDARM